MPFVVVGNPGLSYFFEGVVVSNLVSIFPWGSASNVVYDVGTNGVEALVRAAGDIYTAQLWILGVLLCLVLAVTYRPWQA